MSTSPLALHVERFNAAVRSGDFGPMLDAFADDAEMVFEGVRFGPLRGRDEIARAYAERPPVDEARLLGPTRFEDGAEVGDYAWASAGTHAGRMLLTERDGRIARFVITFEERSRGDLEPSERRRAVSQPKP